MDRAKTSMDQALSTDQALGMDRTKTMRRLTKPLHRLKRRAEFLAVAGGVKAPRRAFLLQMGRERRGTDAARFGFTVTKKTGNSPERTGSAAAFARRFGLRASLTPNPAPTMFWSDAAPRCRSPSKPSSANLSPAWPRFAAGPVGVRLPPDTTGPPRLASGPNPPATRGSSDPTPRDPAR